MKIEAINLNNFANYSKISFSLNPDVTFLVGANGSGKSTAGITGVQAIFQGIAEKATNGTQPIIGERYRFIGGAGATSTNSITLIDDKNNNAKIVITRKITKTGTELRIDAPESYGKLDQSWLNSLFNLFMVNPKAFTQLSGIEQAKAIGIDTSSIDAEIATLKDKAKTIRIELKQYDGLVPVEKAEPVVIDVLKQSKWEAEDRWNKKYLENKGINQATRTEWEAAKKQIDADVEKFNKEQTDLVLKYNACADALSILKLHGYDGTEINLFLLDIKEQMKPTRIAADEYPTAPTDLSAVEEGYTPAEGEKVYIKEMPDDTELKEIDQQILDATETNRKALLYSQYLEKKEKKEAKEKELADNLQAQSNKADERIKYIQGLKLPFSNLTIDEDGQLLLQDKTQQYKPIKEPYFSTGEILKIVPILVTHKNPELKYVFVQGFRDLDDDNWAQVESYLLERGFQIVVEVVSKEKIAGKNCILLRDNNIVDSYEEEIAPKLV